MTYEQFKDRIVTSISERFNEDTLVSINQVKKNNGIALDGLTIREKDINIAPTIYLENFYQDYKSGSTFDEVMREICQVYERNKLAEDIDISFFKDFEKVKENITFKLINKEMNEELLKEVPHIIYLDLAIVFSYYMPMEFVTGGESSILIRNSHMELWDATVDDLYNYAKENTPRLLGLHLRGMFETLEELMGKENMPQEFANPEMYTPIYVATNERKTNGAGVILYKDMLKALAAKTKSDLAVIPCSVHEVIIITADGKSEDWLDGIRSSISYVNETEVDARDVLSNNLYYYYRDREVLGICS
ncbi:MAG: DUF5688 family protein [Pseudobutyrivibrio sp.]|nr:DUF5688 family protein [Pseudobutyrivibrio sp.]